MTTKYFKCKLLTDVVLNSSLATEGNMKSLDFIPGSNFLGIVAKELYKKSNNETFDIFHSENVLFGDALISKNGKISYTLPFSLFQEKGKDKISEDTVWVHHKLSEFKRAEMPKDENGDFRQLKQNRSGYLNTESKFIKKVEKSFSLKSAYNRKERRSADGKMFGFDAIQKGQEFIFSVIFNDEAYIETVTNALTGKKRLGKSKTAQYGQIDINPIDKPETFESKDEIKNNKLVIFAESRLCFLDENGNSSFQPIPKDFGVEKDDFTWNACQIRTGSYSPWNAKRNTPDSQRNFIERGSVFVIELTENENIDIEKLQKQVGEYQNEGFGRVIYNPEFLEYKEEDGIWDYSITEYEKNKNKDVEKSPIESDLGKFLKAKSESEDKELEIGNRILRTFNSKDGETLSDSKITKSQWGAIRTKATYAKNLKELNSELFAEKTGYLVHGVSAEKIWDKYGRRNALKRIIEENSDLETKFVAKFAAEIAKKN